MYRLQEIIKHLLLPPPIEKRTSIVDILPNMIKFLQPPWSRGSYNKKSFFNFDDITLASNDKNDLKMKLLVAIYHSCSHKKIYYRYTGTYDRVP